MESVKDYSYNIFENVSKGRLIDEVNGKYNNSIFYLLGSIISFNYIKKTAFSCRIIIDIPNYEEEIKYFNSFNIFIKYDNHISMINENFQMYINSRNIKQITYQKKLKKEFSSFESTISFKEHLEYHERKKISSEIASILIEKVRNPIIETFKIALKERFSEFCFQNVMKLPKFQFHFYNFENVKDCYLNNVEYDRHLFNEFQLSVYGIHFRNSKDELLDNRLNLVIEFCDCFSVIAEYLGYNVYFGANQSTIFGNGENYFIFKKINSDIL